MKILIYRYNYDPNFESVISVISEIKHQIGYASGEVNQDALLSFSPDIIIHNIPNCDNFPIKNNAVSININDSNSKYSFSFTKKTSSNYIKPFVHLRDSYVKENELSKFESDIVYIGSPAVFTNILDYITQFNFKFFTNQPHNIIGYCGNCNMEDCFRFYKNSKACLVCADDEPRILDIVAAGGNPIVYDVNNGKECKDKIYNAIHYDQKYVIDKYKKEDILANHTSYDATAKIFKTIGLNKISEELLKNKKYRISKQ